MKSIEARLLALEPEKNKSGAPVAKIVIYDPLTGKPLAPVDEKAGVVVWMPDNGRGDRT